MDGATKVKELLESTVAQAIITDAERLTALRLHLMPDSRADASFDRLTALAARLLDAPIAIIAITGDDRIRFKSHHGLSAATIDRLPELRTPAALDDLPYVITDAERDPRTLANPLVTGPFALRFHVASPLITAQGHRLGMMCVIGHQPRSVGMEQIRYLEDLAALAMDQIELRLSTRGAVSDLSDAVDDLSQAVVTRDLLRGRTELMMREIDHRVMNSLQFISSLLDMQSRTASPEAAAELQLAARRVGAVARVHRHFYLDEAVEKTDGFGYLRRLCSDLATSLGDGITIEVVGTLTAVPTTRILPLGLIVNELATNASKHGARNITVSFQAGDAGGYVVCVADDGTGLPEDFKPGTGTGLGLRIIQALTKQLNGTLTHRPAHGEQGTVFEIRFR